MRKSLLLFGLCLATLMISCKKENTEAVLSADMADSARTGQKAIIDAERYSCFVVGEKMRVNNETGTVTSLTNGGRGCNIGSVTQKQSGMYYSFYPADMIPANSDLSNGFANLTVTIPQVQIYDKDENGNQIINNPMAAELDAASGKVLHYRNLCALLKVTVNTTGTLDSIRVYCKGANLWGTGKVNTTDWKLDINANSSKDSCYAYLYFPGGHEGKGKDEVFYIVVPQTVVTADAGKFSIEVDMIHNNYHKPFQIRLTNDKTLKYSTLYSLGSYTFELVPFKSGIFTVNTTAQNMSQVIFSPGNLQFSPTGGGYVTAKHCVAGSNTPNEPGTWRFAPRQYDYVGYGNEGISGLTPAQRWKYSGWIDLFGWATSGAYRGYSQFASPMDPDSACQSIGMDIVAKYDWGQYNDIYNPWTRKTDKGVASGDGYKAWHVITGNMWKALMFERGESAGWWRFNMVRLQLTADTSVLGLLLYPDGWMSDSLNIGFTRNSMTVKDITKSQFEKFEGRGCVFLPAAGKMVHRSGDKTKPHTDPYIVSEVREVGHYWTSHDIVYNGQASGLIESFSANGNNGSIQVDTSYRWNGYSVRLVKFVK